MSTYSTGQIVAKNVKRTQGKISFFNCALLRINLREEKISNGVSFRYCTEVHCTKVQYALKTIQLLGVRLQAALTVNIYAQEEQKSEMRMGRLKYRGSVSFLSMQTYHKRIAHSMKAGSSGCEFISLIC